ARTDKLQLCQRAVQYAGPVGIGERRAADAERVRGSVHRDHRLSVGFERRAVVFVAESEIERQVAAYPPIVLEEAAVFALAPGALHGLSGYVRGIFAAGGIERLNPTCKRAG